MSLHLVNLDNRIKQHLEDADIVQLVEHNFAKVEVAGSRPAVRSNIIKGSQMPRNVTLVSFCELLRTAEAIGYTWNGAHEFLRGDGIPPEAEVNSIEYYIDDFGDDNEDYCWSADTRKVMQYFFVTEGLTKFTLVND